MEELNHGWVRLDRGVPSPIYTGWEKLEMETEWVGCISHPELGNFDINKEVYIVMVPIIFGDMNFTSTIKSVPDFVLF